MWRESNLYSRRRSIEDTEDVQMVFNYKKPDLNDYNETWRANKMSLLQLNGRSGFMFQGFEIIAPKLPQWQVNDMLGFHGLKDEGIDYYYDVVKFPKKEVEGRLRGPLVQRMGDDYFLMGLKPSNRLKRKLLKEDRLLHFHVRGVIPEEYIFETAIYVPVGVVGGLQRLADRLV